MGTHIPASDKPSIRTRSTLKTEHIMVFYVF